MTTTSDRTSLLANVCASPDDDTPRLVFADWLEEHGEPGRGEFIRVQCELARCGPEPKKLGLGPGGANTLRAVGPDYWTFHGDGDGDPTAAVGDRVDVLVHRVHLKGDKHKWMRGLLVTRVMDEGSDGIRYTVKRDDLSKRWAGEPLREQERELWTASNARRWGLGDGWRHTLHRETIDPDYGATLPAAFVSRGFVSAIALSAADWLQHADAIAWHPDATTMCPALGCAEGYVIRLDHQAEAYNRLIGRLPMVPPRKRVRCPTCHGTGRVPRPCPPTAQPITDVTLVHMEGIAVGVPLDADATLTDARWPGVRFRVAADRGPPA